VKTNCFNGQMNLPIADVIKNPRLKVGLVGTHLFVKVPRPRDSEVTFSVFKSSCHLLLSV